MQVFRLLIEEEVRIEELTVVDLHPAEFFAVEKMLAEPGLANHLVGFVLGANELLELNVGVLCAFDLHWT